MRFKVREGFVVHIEKLIDRDGKKESNTKSFFAGETCELSEEDANAHLHKLEALDKDARAHVDTVVVDIPPPQAAAIDQDALAAGIAGALVALGVVLPAAPATAP